MLRHALPIVAHFDWALAVTLAAPETSLAPLVAPGLTLDTFKNCGFMAVACVKTRRLRPKGFPNWLGMDFFLVGYRLFVRFESTSGRRLRGLQILGSETDRWPMAIAGRMFTHYAYRRVKASATRENGGLRVKTSSGVEIVTDDEATLPAGSIFTEWNEARRFAGPMPFTFASAQGGRAIVKVEGGREHWEPRPVAVRVARVPFLEKLAPDSVPAAAFLVESVDYAWKRGELEKLR